MGEWLRRYATKHIACCFVTSNPVRVFYISIFILLLFSVKVIVVMCGYLTHCMITYIYIFLFYINISWSTWGTYFASGVQSGVQARYIHIEKEGVNEVWPPLVLLLGNKCNEVKYKE